MARTVKTARTAKTLVVVGAGPGLGMGVARAFGRHGFRVGLIARTKEKLDALVDELAALGVTAASLTVRGR